MFMSEDGRLTGLIDFESAAVGDRHLDFRYVSSGGPRFTRTALDAYAREAGTSLDPQIVGRCEVWSAFRHFAFIGPDEERFPQIVEWATESVKALTPEWGR